MHCRTGLLASRQGTIKLSSTGQSYVIPVSRVYFLLQLVSQRCCVTSCRKNYLVWHGLIKLRLIRYTQCTLLSYVCTEPCINLLTFVWNQSTFSSYIFSASSTQLLCVDVNCLNDVCGMSGVESREEAKQWYRLITPIFLHLGKKTKVFSGFSLVSKD